MMRSASWSRGRHAGCHAQPEDHHAREERGPIGSTELRRNALPSGRYSPLHAAGAYQLRRRREGILEKDPTLRTFVRDRLAEGWAPEQIAGWLKAGNERGLRASGFEAIYAFIYRAAHKGEDLWRYLTRRSRFHPPTAQEHRC
jgi:IS30 family transposase